MLVSCETDNERLLALCVFFYKAVGPPSLSRSIDNTWNAYRFHLAITSLDAAVFVLPAPSLPFLSLSIFREERADSRGRDRETNEIEFYVHGEL